MSQNNTKKKSVKGTIWSFIDNFMTIGCSFVIGVVLARLLSPSDYGTVGVLSIFLSLANVFVDCGFGTAIIRKKERTQEDMSTAFYFNVGLGVFVYLVLFLVSPLVADFFRMPILKILLRVLALCVFFNSLSIVQTAQFTANLKIKTIATVNVCTQIPMGLVGIYFAYKGFGVWTLVIQQVGSSFFKTLLLWVLSKWRPSLVFNKESFHYLFNFGWKLLSANLIGAFFNEIYSFFIGRFLGASKLGFYSKANNLATQPRSILTNVINRVVLPIMVETQGDTDKVRSVYSRLIQMVCFVVFPVYFLLIAVARPLILILWTSKWEATITLFMICCAGFCWGPISQLNFSLLQLLNRTDLTLKLEFFKKPICLMLLLCGAPFGLTGVVVSCSVYNVVAAIVNMYPTKSLLDYGYWLQFKDILKYLGIAVCAFGVAYISCCLIDNNILSLLIGTIVYAAIYLPICYVCKLAAFNDFKNIILKK